MFQNVPNHYQISIDIKHIFPYPPGLSKVALKYPLHFDDFPKKFTFRKTCDCTLTPEAFTRTETHSRWFIPFRKWIVTYCNPIGTDGFTLDIPPIIITWGFNPLALR